MDMGYSKHIALIILAAFLGACTSYNTPDPGAPTGTSAAETGALEPSGFETSQLFKTDIDQAAELTQQRALDGLQAMMIKLYKRNPKYWRAHADSAEQAVNKIFGPDQPSLYVAELENRWAGDAVNLAFDPTFEGDRVRAFVVGLLQMLMASYDNQTAFYITSDLDPQRLYNCARNFERAAWLLNTRMQSNREPYLIANSMAGGEINLSIERIFGNLIALQDLMAELTAEEQNRAIKSVVHSLTTVFLPI